MSKKRKITKGKKDRISIYKYLRSELELEEKMWKNLHHGELPKYLIHHNRTIPEHASMQIAEKASHIENQYIYVEDTAGRIICYKRKPFNPETILKDLNQSEQILEQKRREILRKKGYDYDPETKEVRPIEELKREQYQFPTEKVNRLKRKRKPRY